MKMKDLFKENHNGELVAHCFMVNSHEVVYENYQRYYNKKKHKN